MSMTGGSGPGNALRTAVREAVYAWMAVLHDPGRLLRFAGIPTLLFLATMGWVILGTPGPAVPGDADAELAWIEANAPTTLFGMLVLLWSQMRFTVRWCRWTVTGDDNARLLDPGLGLTELKLAAWFLVLGFLLLPVLFVWLLVASVFTGLGAGLMSAAGEAAANAGAVVGSQIGLQLGFPIVAFAIARTLPALVPVALGGRAALGRTWKATGPVQVEATLVVFLVLLPANLLDLGLGLFGLPVDHPLRMLSHVMVVLGAMALVVAAARLWSGVVDPQPQVRTAAPDKGPDDNENTSDP